jgi:hypothetical protein
LLLQTFLRITPDTMTRGIFFNDRGHAFSDVLLYGHEGTLLMCQALIFGLADYWTRKYVVGCGFFVVVCFASVFFSKALSS